MNFVGTLVAVFASVAVAGVLITLTIVYWRRRAAGPMSERDRTQVLNDRFIAIGTQLSDDRAAVRLAGVYALADLADDWEENRQSCIDVLCGYLRIPYEPDPGGEVGPAEQAELRGNREIRHSVIRVIAEHLREGAAASWQGANFDLTGTVFDGGDFSGAVFSGGAVSFAQAKFCGETVRFNLAEFSGAAVSFDFAKFSGGTVYFGGASFSGGAVSFDRAEFTDGTVRFDYAEFSGGAVSFAQAKFSGATVSFDGAELSGGMVSFSQADFFEAAVHFVRARFAGAAVRFDGVEFAAVTVDFSDVADWSYPAMFDWEGPPPSGIVLPAAHGATPS